MSFFCKENVAFIPSNLILSQIYKRLYELNQSCGFQYSPYGIYDVIIDSYTIVYTLKECTTLELIQNDASQIVGAMVIIINHDLKIMELYGVCVDKNHRSKGIAKKMLNTLQNYILHDYVVWLGVEMTNLMWKTVLKLYVTNNFSHPSITNTTPSGLRLNINVIQLWYKYESEVNIKDVIKEANKLRLFFFQHHKERYLINYIIKRSLFNTLKCYINARVEYAGVLYIKNEKLKLDKNSIVKGNEFFEVQTPISAITFHTHPETCYRKFKCYVGWPSGGDMRNITYNYYNGLKKHYIITYEGVYSIQLNMPFQLFLDNIKGDECVDVLLKIIFKEFTLAEYHREFMQIDPKQALRMHLFNEPSLLLSYNELKEQKFMEYMNKINKFTLHSLLDGFKRFFESEKLEQYKEYVYKCMELSSIDENFVLYNVKFWNWTEIDANEFVIENIFEKK